MDKQPFDALEEKVNNILALLERVKKDNEDLRQKNQELQALVNEKELKIQSLNMDLESFRKVKTEVDSYRENQDHIRGKVESLLQKLKEFEDF